MESPRAHRSSAAWPSFWGMANGSEAWSSGRAIRSPIPPSRSPIPPSYRRLIGSAVQSATATVGAVQRKVERFHHMRPSGLTLRLNGRMMRLRGEQRRRGRERRCAWWRCRCASRKEILDQIAAEGPWIPLADFSTRSISSAFASCCADGIGTPPSGAPRRCVLCGLATDGAPRPSRLGEAGSRMRASVHSCVSSMCSTGRPSIGGVGSTFLRRSTRCEASLRALGGG